MSDRKGKAASLNKLGNIARKRGDLDVAERLYRESLAITKEIDDRGGEATLLKNLGSIADRRGDQDEAHRCYTESVRIKREIVIPIDQWLIDKGY